MRINDVVTNILPDYKGIFHGNDINGRRIKVEADNYDHWFHDLRAGGVYTRKSCLRGIDYEFIIM